MASLFETVQADLTTARKAQDKPRTLLLGTVLAALKNRQIELRRPLADEDVIETLRREIKRRNESVEQYERAGRPELAAKEAAEIRLIEGYLPPAVDPDEIRAAVRAAIAGGAGDLGRVMGAVMPQFKGRADGKVINQIVREELQAK